ncbi:hypothetical protein LTR91_022512 [Friedmanniomyces endolithicus]|uniref:RRM domain-containing protein n=1 Tax=Friedmanniomyces endolithicus TaxID=329885 RepID=A0AAN6FDM6_9PEZI|nr:hypothetical protein LTR35_016927 [Friedmanniomyces endolithicus]KAK0272399.1 hypothetical protein LTS00_016238 [Friedmanniomyces endolithicus]KAK0314027.1 hypothetical protein LTR82_013337 [Friedmanniomyces endolithicus]KAK0920243.1 hypothetical protein LTR57_009899 [Friedmanniomyces endolithicus]KAK0956128.1 hypothetical protein LTR91_022512 [Friedmanniomyces endolithicus]
MSIDAPSNKKAKKAQRDTERHGKGRKRKHDETNDLPDGVEQDGEASPGLVPNKPNTDAVADTAPAVKAPKAKKQKRVLSGSGDAVDGEEGRTGDATAAIRKEQTIQVSNEEPKSKDAESTSSKTRPDVTPTDRKARTLARNLRKRRKDKEARGIFTTPAILAENGAAPATDDEPAGDTQTPEDADTTATKSGAKFILFIGNLPFTTTDTALRAHFKKLSPFTLRHRTDPSTGKSKGFAFLEFENYDRMETCLKKYHHTLFDPDDYREDKGKFGGVGGERAKAGKNRGRQINVELTAGGGGKGEGRKEKIRDKNVHLEEERQRRAEQEMSEQAAGGLGMRGGKRGVVEKEEGVSAVGMHPSRLAMMKG